MNRRRFLFVIGCLMAAFVAFASDAAFAQAGDSAGFTANARGHDMIRLTWTHADTNDDLDKFSLRYQASERDTGNATDFDLTKNVMRMDVPMKSSGTYQVTIDELKPATRYVFELTPLGDTGADGDEAFADATTDTADAPDDVMGLMLTAGDGMIMAMWDEATDNGSPVTGYGVRYKMSDEADSKYESARMGRSAPSHARGRRPHFVFSPPSTPPSGGRSDSCGLHEPGLRRVTADQDPRTSVRPERRPRPDPAAAADNRRVYRSSVTINRCTVARAGGNGPARA